MSDIFQYYSKETNELEAILKQIQKTKIPEIKYKIHTSYSHGKAQYCYYEKGKKRIYIPNSDIPSLKEVFTYEYYEELKKAIEYREKLLHNMKEYSQLPPLHSVYEKLGTGKRNLVESLTVSDEEFINNWFEQHPGGQNDYPIEGNYYTLKNEHVRSRAEQTIGDRLNYYNRPYVYESNYYFKDGTFVSADFKTLNLRTRKTWIWEHFGGMGEEEYSAKTVKKINRYANDGIYIGDGLIATFEAETGDFDTRQVNTFIEKYLL